MQPRIHSNAVHRVLVVESDRCGRELLTRQLERIDIAHTVADSLAAGVRALRAGPSEPVDALVIGASDLTTAELASLANLRAEGWSLPVLLVLPPELAERLAYDLHALSDDWIAAPADLRELRFRLEMAVRRRASARAGAAAEHSATWKLMSRAADPETPSPPVP